MRVTVLHRGVPIGEGELALDERLVGGDFAALPGYEGIRPVVRAADRTRANLGFLPPGDAAAGGVNAAGDAAGRAALDRAEVLLAELELREARGGALAHEWLDLWDAPGGFGLMAERGAAPAAAP